ncbi:MAG: tetratricopeptide repeat protein [Candidatus Omnitrophica bacterium]|nr:tetratricopeptide repeat protein [Candidatus Omnitrophota bacterium]
MDRPALVILFLLFGAILFIGLQAVASMPVIDDIPEIQHVQGLQSVKEFLSADCYGFFRPVKNLLFFIFLSVSPDNQAVWHLITLFIYLVVTGLAVFLFDKIIKDKILALAAAVIWALAPTQVSSFIWLSCGNILIMAAFFFSAFIAYESSQKSFDEGRSGRAAIFLAFACGFYLAALLSYESAIILPLVILLWDWFRKRPLLRSRSAILSYVSFGIIAGVYIITRFLVTRNNFTVANESFGPITPIQVSFSSAYFLFDHLFLWLWPFGKQTLLAGTFIWGKTVAMPLIYGSWALLLAAVAAIILTRKTIPLFSFGFAWFFITFIPLCNIIPMKNGPFSDYYLVVPSFGLALALAGLIRYLLSKRPGKGPFSKPLRFAALLICVLIICWRLAAMGLCPGWARLWNDEAELFRKSLSARPYPFAAMASLARKYLLDGKLDDAEKLASQAITDAPWFSNAYNVLGDVYMKKGDYSKAREIFMRAIDVKPNASYPYFALGYIYDAFLNDTAGAKEYYYKTLTLQDRSYFSDAAVNLSRITAMEGDTDKAIEIIEYALRYTLGPASANLHYNAAMAYKSKGNIPLAKKHFESYSKLIKDKRTKWQNL